MGFVRRVDFIEAYQRIRKDAVGRACSILILAAPTVDSLCALKILTSLLKSDYIPFRVVPVSGYDDLVAANDSFLQGRSEIRSVIMIECGASVDVAEFLSLSVEMCVYLIDSHRPYSLVNIFGNSQLTILDDGFIEENHVDLKQAYEGTLLDQAELESFNSDEQTESESPSSNEDSDNENIDTASKLNRMHKQQTRNDKLEKRLFRKKLLDYYKAGTWIGGSVTRLVFELADSLAKVTNDHLWCAILGTTSQFIVEKCTIEFYEEEIRQLRKFCQRLNVDATSNSLQQFGNLGGNEEASNLSIITRRNNSNSHENNAKKTSNIGDDIIHANQQQDETFESCRDGRIKFEPEFRFMLTRHWTLFNSMLHSRYVATRLAVWRDRGRRMLETLLVKMGVPLSQSLYEYASMEMELKESLPYRLAKYASDFGLDNVSYGSFIREYGYVMKISASDAVYALMALLEAPYGPVEDNFLDDSLGSNGGAGGGNFDASPLWIKNFYYAYDALDYHNTDKMKRGIQLAMKQQQVILHEASLILSHQLIRFGRRFRYVILRHSPDLAWLANCPISLSKLALFLVDALRDSKRSHLPLLLAAHLTPTDTYQVVATNGTQNNVESIDRNIPEEPSKNKFGMVFRQAAQKIRARVKHDGFEMSVIEVKAEDLKPFIQTLQTISIL